MQVAAEVGEGSLSKILILDTDRGRADAAVRALKDAISASEIVAVKSFAEYDHKLKSGDFDIVVVDFDLPQTHTLDFIPRLKLRDYEPEVLLVSACDDRSTMQRIAESKSRYIVRDEQWLDSLRSSVRDMLRIRKLESDNASISARLVEANRMLDEKNRRLDDFCATIAHDIRGPLAGLILKLDYILETEDQSLTVKCKNLLQRSLQSSERLVSVVQAMYEFAKIGAKATKMQMISLEDIVENVVGDLNLASSSSIEIKIEKLPSVWGNESLLRRVFLNLIGNAVKYTSAPGGKISIRQVDNQNNFSENFITISVEDNGPGISDQDAEGIFDMFRRGRNSSSSDTEGLGIGLAVVQKIVELHTGTIELQTPDAGGCRFVFTLPSSTPVIARKPGSEATDLVSTKD